MAKAAVMMPGNNVVASAGQPNPEADKENVTQQVVPTGVSEAVQPEVVNEVQSKTFVRQSIKLAFGDVSEAVDASRMTVGTFQFDREQSKVFRRLRQGLVDRSVRLRDGRHIEYPADVLRYLMEQIAVVADDKPRRRPGQC